MNFDLISSNGPVKSSAEPAWLKQFEEWRGLLTKCHENPNRKRVHSLRVATLRLKAEIDFWLLDKDASGRADNTAKNWKKQANKIRKALGSVRNNDVHIEILRKLRAADESSGDESPLIEQRKREIAKLEHRFRTRRESAKKELLSELDRRRERLERTSRELEDEMGLRKAWSNHDRTRLIRGMIAGLASELKTLNASTMHEFRKRAKTARYLADVSARTDPYAKRQALLLKQMLTSVGGWHDLQTLRAEAQEALGTTDGLAKVLEELERESFQNALESSRRITPQLLYQGSRNGVSKETTPPKKPVRRAEITALKGDRLHA